MHELPWVLLGLRTMPKEDLGASTAELVYGTTLSVPGDIVGTNFLKDLPLAKFLQLLCSTTSNFHTQPMSAHDQYQSHVAPDLLTTHFVFVLWDMHRAPLQPPYDGPFPVISRTSKHFVLHYRDQWDTATIDCLKPARIADDTIIATHPKCGRLP